MRSMLRPGEVRMLAADGAVCRCRSEVKSRRFAKLRYSDGNRFDGNPAAMD